MMRICIVTGFTTLESTVANRVSPMVEKFLARGDHVSLISPGVSKLKIVHQNFEHLITGTTINKERNFLLRALGEIKVARNLSRLVKDLEIDITIVTIPSMFAFLVGHFPGKLKCLDVRDLTWEYLDSTSFFNRSVKAFFKFLAKYQIRKYNFISHTNEAEGKYLFDLGVKKDNLFLLSNGINSSKYDQLISIPLRKPSSRLQIGYVGTVGLAQNLETFLKASKANPRCDFHIVGIGTDFNRIVNIVDNENINNLTFHGRLDWEALIGFYSSLDVLYAQLTKDYESAMPSKLYEYITTGKTIIYGGVGEAPKVLSQFDKIQLISPSSESELNLAIASSPELMQLSPHQNRCLIKEKFIRESNSQRYITELSNRCKDLL